MAEVNLFIEDSAVKLLVARGQRVEKWAKLPLEPGLVSDGLILDEAKVAGKIRELFKLQKVGARTVVAGLSGFNSVYRLISLPELPEAILPEAVEQEARRVIPVPRDQVYLSYQSMPTSAGETLIFLAAFPRNTTDALLRTLQKAGLRADVLDLAPLALCRTVDAPEAVVVHVSLASLDIAIMVQRIPQVIRSLSLPGEAQSLSERLTAIVEELNRTITFYNSSHRDKPLGAAVPIFVSGDLAQAPDTWQSLSGTEGYPISALPSPMQPLEGFDSSQFMVNIGLALKQLPLEKEEANFSVVNFNALPQAEKPKKKVSPASILLPIIIVLGCGGVFYMFNLGRNAEARNELLRAQLELTQSQIPEQQALKIGLEEQIAELEPQLEPIKAEADIFNTTFADVQEGRNRIDQEVTQIAHLAPEEVALVYGGDEIMGYTSPAPEASIIHTGDKVTVVGQSQDLDAIFKYARDLRASGGFSEVIISSIDTYEEVLVSGEDEEEIIRGYNFQFTLIQ
jgi:type IV pilus assembly protein PilM